jgi:hypothetical protein
MPTSGTAYILAAALLLFLAGADSAPNASLACTQARGETWLDNAPDALMAIQQACEAAFEDERHIEDSAAACDRQVRELETYRWLQATYVCREAMMIALRSTDKD